VFELLAFEREAPIETPEITTRNVLERQIGLTFDLSVAKHMHDVWMRDVTRESRLLGEHLLRVRLVRDVREHSFQHDDPRFTDRTRLERTEDFRHASNRNAVDQRVLPERGIRWWRRWR